MEEKPKVYFAVSLITGDVVPYHTEGESPERRIKPVSGVGEEFMVIGAETDLICSTRPYDKVSVSKRGYKLDTPYRQRDGYAHDIFWTTLKSNADLAQQVVRAVRGPDRE